MCCEDYKELERVSELMDNAKEYWEFEELNEIADELCLKISQCTKRCGNAGCYGLQNSEELELAFQESQYEF